MIEYKDHADVKIHPPILTLIHIVVAIGLNRILPLPRPFSSFLPIIGWLLFVTGLALAFAAVRQLSMAHTTVDPHGSVSAIVSQGIYRFTRNPIYLAFLLMLIGFPLKSGNYWGVVLAPVFVATMNRLVIEKEEAYLEKKFGDVYTSYKSRVRRWL